MGKTKIPKLVEFSSVSEPIYEEVRVSTDDGGISPRGGSGPDIIKKQVGSKTVHYGFTRAGQTYKKTKKGWVKCYS